MNKWTFSNCCIKVPRTYGVPGLILKECAWKLGRKLSRYLTGSVKIHKVRLRNKMESYENDYSIKRFSTHTACLCYRNSKEHDSQFSCLTSLQGEAVCTGHSSFTPSSSSADNINKRKLVYITVIQKKTVKIIKH